MIVTFNRIQWSFAVVSTALLLCGFRVAGWIVAGVGASILVPVMILMSMASHAFKRDADQIIGHAGSDYMHRWFLTPKFRRLPTVYAHIIRRDDEDRALHDHPSWSLSFICTRGYYEIREKDGLLVRTWYPPGSFIWRSSTQPHRIELKRNDKTGNPESAATLFLMGPRIREWGFHCPEGRWVHWKEFTDDSGDGIGKGCG